MNSREVLVVEDDNDLRESLCQTLRDNGFSVLSTTNGQQALDVLKAGAHPAVILLDLMMPVLNGWELRDALRDDPRLADIPQLVISAYMDEAEQHVLGLPPDDCIRKPFHIRVLLEAVERHSAAAASRTPSA
ncbi:MAG TPA: response regulator [Thermoanaerobaculia bacterium]|nr:response regulator [Thermoanaerobaculia bacterium]